MHVPTVRLSLSEGTVEAFCVSIVIRRPLYVRRDSWGLVLFVVRRPLSEETVGALCVSLSGSTVRRDSWGLADL